MLRFVKNAGASMVRGSVVSFEGGGWSGEDDGGGREAMLRNLRATIVSQIVISNAAAEAT